MANQITSLTYGGYQYEVGNTVRVSNNIMYTTITRPSGNTIHMLSQCVMQITEIWEGTSAGSPVINPDPAKMGFPARPDPSTAAVLSGRSRSCRDPAVPP